jgi:hypothetical protein
MGVGVCANKMVDGKLLNNIKAIKQASMGHDATDCGVEVVFWGMV